MMNQCTIPVTKSVAMVLLYMHIFKSGHVTKLSRVHSYFIIYGSLHTRLGKELQY